MKNKSLFLAAIVFMAASGFSQPNTFQTVPLQSQITSVQPMTGIVLWEELKNKDTDAISMEYSYMRYNDIVKEKGVYDWSDIEKKLNSIASRSHQAVLRFWDTYPGRESSVPDYIKSLPDYKNIVAKSEKRDTGFPDWSHPEYQRFIMEFFEKFAEKYDNDPRLAFLQVGFGLWSEYHIYQPGEIPGTNFPGFDFQEKYIQHLDTLFQVTPWMISQDAQDSTNTPFKSQPQLLKSKFGIFDDSFHLAWKPSYNYDGWKFFGLERYKESPMGGEILFGNKERSDFVESKWAIESRRFGITFMVCEQWVKWIGLDKLKQHSMACGYKYQVTDIKTSANYAKVTVKNTGVAPIYYDAFVTVNGVRSTESLKTLQPGESREYKVKSGSNNPVLTIECDRLVAGQKIEYEANIK